MSAPPPTYFPDWKTEAASVMTLRDYFAAQALSGMVRANHRLTFNPEDDAHWCYGIADAMLKERSRDQPK